jgi:DNA polymerase-3 subunit gamma/tau
MAKQLYQKYRPNSLDEIIGQDKTVLNLKKRFQEKTFPQSIVLIGESGLGKSSLERIIAMAIVCQNSDKVTGDPCLKCANCLDIINEDFLLSVHEKNCSNLGIDQIRELEEKSREQNFSGAPQVFILDEYQEMEAKAQKNLLKMIENENKNAYFLISTMDKSKIPDAVKARSQSFYLKQVDPNVLVEWMVSLLDKENIKYPGEFLDPDIGGLFVIADSCKGSPRTALSMLEQAIYSELWTEKEIMAEMDIISIEGLNTICAGIIQHQAEFVFTTKWSSELVYEIRARFVEVFKYLNGIEPKSEYFKKQIIELASISTKEKIEVILNVFFEMNRVFSNFWNQNFIEFSVLRAIHESELIDKKYLPSTPRQRIPLKG